MQTGASTGYVRHAAVAALALSVTLLAALVPTSPINSPRLLISHPHLSLVVVGIIAIGVLVDAATTAGRADRAVRSSAGAPWSLVAALLLPIWPAVALSAVASLSSALALRYDRRTMCRAVVAETAAITLCHLTTGLMAPFDAHDVFFITAIGFIVLAGVRRTTELWLNLPPRETVRTGGSSPAWWSLNDHLAVWAVGAAACLLALVFAPALALLVPVSIAILRARQAGNAIAGSCLDEKTGLLRPQEWLRRADVVVERRRRRAHQFIAVIIIDLDHFKALNDVHGHVVGDIALKKVGDCLRTAFRKGDVVGRFGGEEFTVLLPSADLADGVAAANRAIERVRQIEMDDGVRVTASAGVAVHPSHGQSLGEVLQAADRALYSAKSSGRDQARAA